MNSLRADVVGTVEDSFVCDALWVEVAEVLCLAMPAHVDLVDLGSFLDFVTTAAVAAAVIDGDVEIEVAVERTKEIVVAGSKADAEDLGV